MNKKEFLSYPFLNDHPDDLRCDFEILSDEICSQIAILNSLVDFEDRKQELIFISQSLYHINPALRMKNELKQEEFDRLYAICHQLQQDTRHLYDRFVLPHGCQSAAQSHLIRNKFKALARLMYRHRAITKRQIDEILFDFVNLSSQYFFFLSLFLNEKAGIAEIPFESRSYKQK